MSRFGLQKLYIHGAYVDSTAGKTFNAINPANGEVLAEVQAAGAEDVDRAVASAASGAAHRPSASNKAETEFFNGRYPFNNAAGKGVIRRPV